MQNQHQPTPISKTSKVSTAFFEGVSNLLGELKLAILWDRPSILLAIYKSESVRIKAERELERELKKISQKLTRVQIDRAQSDIGQILTPSANPDDMVFSIMGIRNSGGEDGRDAYRTLNMHRESLVERKFRIILWLTENESRQLPQFAPDFWAFRHRVIEFALDRLKSENTLPSGILLWNQPEAFNHPQRIQEDAQYYRQLLEELPEKNESVSMRIEILFKLAHLDWIRGQLTDAKKNLGQAFLLAKQLNIGSIDASLLNALAIIAYEIQNMDDALNLLKRATASNPKDSLTAINLGITYQALGQRQNAIVTSKRAARLDPKNPKIWNALAHLFLTGGQLEIAQSSFEHALSLDPQNPYYYLGLAVYYFIMDDIEGVEKSLGFINDLGRPSSKYYHACEAALRGNEEGAIKLLREGLLKQELMAPVLRRDPILQYIFGAEAIKLLI